MLTRPAEQRPFASSAGSRSLSDRDPAEVCRSPATIGGRAGYDRSREAEAGSIPTFRAVAAGVVLAGGVLLGTAGSVASAQSTPIALPCLVPTPVTPGHFGLIGNQQNGQTICLELGAKLLVSLLAPGASGVAWQSVVVAPGGILAKTEMPGPVRAGVTSSAFLARRQGIAKLTSERRACAPAAGSASCNAMLGWKVTVVVRGLHKSVPQPQQVAPPPLVRAA
jgi:hypothetical protein